MRAQGIDAQTIEGGIQAWRKERQLLVRVEKLPRAIPPKIGQRVSVAGGPGADSPAHFDQPLDTRVLEVDPDSRFPERRAVLAPFEGVER